MNMNQGPENKWSLQPFPGSDLKIGSKGAPSKFHRWMQRKLLGFVWTKIEKGKR